MSGKLRIDIAGVDPHARAAAMSLQRYVNSSDLEKSLIALVDIRASQINRCARCLDMHIAEALEAGAPQRQINLVATWQEAPGFFSAREQAALALTEHMTLISVQGVSDEVWQLVEQTFTPEESVQLIMTISAINMWNRMNVTAGTPLIGEEN